MRAILRLFFLVPLAFVLSCIAAGLFFVVGLIGVGPDGSYFGRYFWDTVLLVFAVSSATGATVAVPALAAGLLAEVFRWRSPFFYLLLGAVLGVWVIAILRSTGTVSPEVRQALFPASGAVGGLVYWLLAGRSAGIAAPRLSAWRSASKGEAAWPSHSAAKTPSRPSAPAAQASGPPPPAGPPTG